MSIEFIGMIAGRLASEVIAPQGPAVDPEFVQRFAKAHEDGGFDRILIGYYSNGPDGFLIGALAASATTRLGLLLAHRPGFVAPTVAARKFATLDQISRGRLAMHVISGGDDQDQRRDGDWLDHDGRYARSEEYVGILKRLWSSSAPVSHSGAFYRFEGASPEPATFGGGALPIYVGGSSDAAISLAAKHADVYALWGEPLDEARETIRRVRAAAAREGRRVRISLSTRPIIGPTEDAAWARAEEIRAETLRLRGGAEPQRPANAGSRRLLEAAARGEVLDDRLWTPIAAITGAKGNTTALVGTAEQVADALVRYWEIGVTTFLIRGFDPLADAIVYGRDLLPLVRERIARRLEDLPVAI
jgi:alkanesulfonate monooxygenase